MTAEDVAETLGLPADMVYRTARTYGLQYRKCRAPLTVREEARVVALIRAGLNEPEIRARLSVSRGAIRRARQAAGLSRKGVTTDGRRFDADTHKTIAHMRLVEGYSYGDISAALGVTRGVVAGAIYRARRKNGKLRACVEKEVERS